MREEALLDPDDEDGFPLAALRSMDRGQGHSIVDAVLTAVSTRGHLLQPRAQVFAAPLGEPSQGCDVSEPLLPVGLALPASRSTPCSRARGQEALVDGG